MTTIQGNGRGKALWLRDADEIRVIERTTQQKGTGYALCSQANCSSTQVPSTTLKVNDAALECNRHRVRPIIGTQLGEYVCYMTLDGRLANIELIGNVFVGIACRHQP